MRHIYALSSEKVPRDDEFKFRERAKALVDKWHDVLSANKPNGNGASAGETKADSVEKETGTNGVEAHLKTNGDAMEVEKTDAMETDVAVPAPVVTASKSETVVGTSKVVVASSTEEISEDADMSALPDITMSEFAV